MDTVAIIGAGTVGRALGQRLIQVGAEVRFGVRAPETTGHELTGALADAAVLAPAAAADAADIVLLAVPATAALAAVEPLRGQAGRIIVDCTNPVRWDGGPIWAPPPQGSVTQALVAAYPALRFVKGFNHFGAEIQSDPALASGPADALFAGDDGAAKSAAMALATRMGFEAQDAGPLRNAALLENLAVLWIQLAVAGGVGRDFSFRIERR